MIAAQSANSGTTFGLDALLLLDVSDAEDIKLVNRKDIVNGLYGFYPINTDFTFTRSGKKIYVALQDRLWVLDVPSLNILMEEEISGPQFGHANFIKSFGSPGKVLGAWNNVTFGTFDAEDETCIQSGPEILRIDPETGDYQFADCNGITLNGTGVIRVRGCTITLQHNSPDRRIMAMINTCQNRGTATVQVLSPRRTYNLTDMDITNGCGCD
jgi:hypothetical protein